MGAYLGEGDEATGEGLKEPRKLEWWTPKGKILEEPRRWRAQG